MRVAVQISALFIFIRARPSWKRGWRRSEAALQWPACAVASLFKVRVDNLNHVLSRFLARF
jgi:hypothetical protein